MTKTSIDGQALKKALGAGVAQLAKDVELINQLNVFPVPDGDTGINMYHTLKRAWQEISELSSNNVSEIAQRFAFGALMGARGNSGTILSQLLKGFAQGLNNAATLGPPVLLAGCRAAVERAYAAVSQPVEGTILTVAREATDSLDSAGLEGASLDDMLDSLVRAAEHSLAGTPLKLPILKEAGVVDAGGMGLLSFLRGMQGQETVAASFLTLPTLSEIGAQSGSPNDSDSYGYDVQFVMHGAGMNLSRIRTDLEKLGWSVIVVGDDATIKVHIHVDNPARPIDYAITKGAVLDDIVVENMQLQYEEFAAQGQMQTVATRVTSASDVAVIAVAEGAGIQSVLRELNCALVIDGGAGWYPATEDFINAVKRQSASHVIILPNDRNIVMAAQQAAPLIAEKKVAVLPTESVLQGISAMIAYGDAADGGADPDTMADRMREAVSNCSALSITQATRDTKLGKLTIRERDYLAIIDGQLEVASADLESALLQAMRKVETADKELATLYFGAGISSAEASRLIERLSKCIDELEFEMVDGGQSLYPILISVE